MKKIKIFVFFIFVISSFYLFGQVQAVSLTKTDLIYLVVDGVGRTVTTSTTISEIEQWYKNGTKLETDSLFGGKAYSFYIGDKYDDYLYLETLEDGRIFSYGSTDPTYVTNTYSYGDDYPYTERNSLHGCMISDEGIVIAGIHYYKSIYLNGSSSRIISAYKEAFSKDETKAMLDLSKHATLMFNSIERAFNNENCFLTFNEDYFYINQQFRKFGTTLMTYMYNMGYGLSYYTTLGSKSNCDLAYSVYYCMNPLQLAGMAKLQKNANFGDRIYPVWDYNSETKILAGAVYSPTCFDRADSVSLTSTESSRLGAGRQEYMEAIDYLNRTSTIYKTTPINNSATNIRAGELLQDKKEGITHYMNAIRVAGGLGRVALDEEGFNIAQHMSTLLSYRFIELGLPMTHLPAQPEGVSLEYYRTAIGYEKAWNDNLAYSASDVSVTSMLRYINILLEDEDGTYNFGHRHYLLDKEFTRFGYGMTEFFGVVELDGYRQSDNIAVGWPMVDGVTFLETLIDEKFKWTVKFESKYEVQNTSTVRIECLNTGDVWDFDTEIDNYSKLYQNLVEGEVLTSFSNKILLYDYTIEPRAGYVYKVTVNGLKNTETGNIESYSYRTVFEYADTSSYPTTLSDLKILTDNLYEVKDRTGVYYAPIGMSLSLGLELDTSIVDKKVTWTSSNPDIVSVTQDGTIYASAPSEEEVTITVKFDGSNVTDQIVVMPYISLEDVTLNHDSIEMLIDPNSTNSGYDFNIETVPEEVTEILDVDWVLSDGTTEYYLTLDDGEYIFASTLDINNNLNDYFEVLSVSYENDVIKGMTLRTKKIKNGIYQYKLKTYVTAMSDMYRDGKLGGACDINVFSPITQINSYIIIDGEEKSLTTLSRLNVTGNSPYEYTLTSKVLPTDTNEVISSETWSSGNERIATVDDSGKLTVKSIGTVKLTKTTVTERKRTIKNEYTITIAAPITSLRASLENYNMSEGRYIVEYTTKPISINIDRVPEINTDNLVYEVIEGDNLVASVADGEITFKGVGDVTVDISSQTNSSVKTQIKFKVFPPSNTLEFVDSKGEKVEYLNIDFNELSSNGIANITGYRAIYNLDSSINCNSYPDVTYSVKHGGEDIVEVNSITGDLIVKQGGETQIIASVPTASGTPHTIEYTLISNKRSDIDKITLNSSNVSYANINDEGEYVYYIYKGSTYKFTIEGDPTSNDELLFSTVSLLSKIKNEYIEYGFDSSNKILTVKALSAGETSIEVRVDTCSYVPADKDGNKVTLSNISDVIELGDENAPSKTFKLKFIVSDYLKGDMNKDGYVNSTDSSMVLDLYKNGGATLEDYQIGDMNEDGLLNSTDAAMILDIFKNGR